jgi:hypothetical protein
VKRLIKATFHNTQTPVVPDISRLFEVDKTIDILIIFLDVNHLVAKPDYHKEPLQMGKKIVKDSKVEFCLQLLPVNCWYVVTCGINFCSVVHGAALWQTMVPGFNKAKGMQMPTCASAKHTYHVAVACRDV